MTDNHDKAAATGVAAITLTRFEAFAPGKGGARLLGPLDLVVQPGEHVLVVGPSGCGKTTLLRALAGLAEHHAGRIRLFGEEASRDGVDLVRPEQRGVGYLFQGGALWPHMSVAKTLAFSLASSGLTRSQRDARVAELIGLVELEGLESRRPGELSGGEAQRLNLARALAREPQLLLLDEPLGPLDAPLRAALLERIHAIQASRDLTILHVTHDPREAAEYATRTLSFEGGALVGDEHHATTS